MKLFKLPNCIVFNFNSKKIKRLEEENRKLTEQLDGIRNAIKTMIEYQNEKKQNKTRASH